MIRAMVYLAFTGAFVGLIIANVYVSGSLSTGGIQLRQYEQEQAQLTEEIKQLEAQILEENSLHQLRDRAEKLGFDKPEQIIAVGKSSQDVALRP